MSVNVSLIVSLAVAAFFGVVLIGAVIQGWEHRKNAKLVSVLSWGASVLAIVAFVGIAMGGSYFSIMQGSNALVSRVFNQEPRPLPTFEFPGQAGGDAGDSRGGVAYQVPTPASR